MLPFRDLSINNYEPGYLTLRVRRNMIIKIVMIVMIVRIVMIVENYLLPFIVIARTDQSIAVTERTENREPAGGNGGSLVAAPPMNIAVAGTTNAMERGEGVDESKGQLVPRSKDDNDRMGVSGEEEHTESVVAGDDIVDL